ncbi:hypothetical protein [Thalassospira aquimaris]|uniref:Uncharacterized protein n=1 Tax=Thalassospira aquimaris TaxID=3037796 RepID=A0ABT6GGH5_9PROT|nr:hypothetical protein [Thalassospira sp. FZY0004]MDG4721182.1 hypothetical protein [Thalassospira sp. FZY0004]
MARLGRIVMNHGGFFKRLEGGGDCKTAVYERFQSIFKDGAEWESAKAEARERDSKTSAEAVT